MQRLLKASWVDEIANSSRQVQDGAEKQRSRGVNGITKIDMVKGMRKLGHELFHKRNQAKEREKAGKQSPSHKEKQ